MFLSDLGVTVSLVGGKAMSALRCLEELLVSCVVSLFLVGVW